MRRSFSISLLCAAAVGVTASVSMAGAGAGAASRYSVASFQRVTRGLVYERIIDHAGPNEAFVLKLDPTTRLSLDVALAQNQLPGVETTSSMASRNNAIAAINGDYFVSRWSGSGGGRPLDIFAHNGNLLTSPYIWGNSFALSADERHTHFDHVHLAMSVKQKDSGVKWDVSKWNSDKHYSGYVVSTPEGGSAYGPPSRACSIRLTQTSGARWGSTKKIGVERSYSTSKVLCRYQPMHTNGGVVVSAAIGSQAAANMKSQIHAGESVYVKWGMGWPQVLDTIGGNPILVRNGQTVFQCTGNSYFCSRNPRTGIGVTDNGHLILAIVDGRRSGSVGMKPGEFADLFKHLGAKNALNLDGGGSSTMYLRGSVRNVPSDGPERPVATSLLVLRGADPNQPSPGAFTPHMAAGPMLPLLTATPPAPAPAPLDEVRAEMTDPASTGGFLQALQSGALGHSTHLPAPLQRVAGAFRRAHSHA